MYRYQAPAEGWNQNKQRGLALFLDQHRDAHAGFPDGRPWWCYTERPADGAMQAMPVGELIPHGWDAPWFPEAKYMAMSMKTLSANRFTINYSLMIADYQAAMDEYYMRAAQEAAAIGQPVPDYGEAITWKLRAIVGAPPKSAKIPEAALAGDRWLLGFVNQPNDDLERLLYVGDPRIGRPKSTPVPINPTPPTERNKGQFVRRTTANAGATATATATATAPPVADPS